MEHARKDFERNTNLSKISFLTNEDIWKTIPEIIKASKRTGVAVAYLGTDGAKLLPLKKGDRLIVDMSPATVKAGATNPFEIEKLIKRGVKVFSRRDLHAKITLTDKALLVGSANISKNSRAILDEAAIYTTDPIALQRSKDFINQICTEPVFQKYLKECQKIYKPPRYSKSQSSRSNNKPNVTRTKLWLISLVESEIPSNEKVAFERSEKKANRLIKNKDRSTLENWYWTKPSRAKVGDWMIQCMKNKDQTIEVYSPTRLILIDEYFRNKIAGAKRFVHHMEAPIGGQSMKWRDFKKAFKSITHRELEKPRMIEIKDPKQADELLRLWTDKGRIRKTK